MYSTDKRWKQLGDLLVNYSTEVKPGEQVMIAMVELESYPLMRACYEAVIKAGGYPQVQFLSETLRRSLLLYGDEEQLSWVPEIEAHGMEWADVYLGLRGAHNLAELWDIPANRLSLSQAANGKILVLALVENPLVPGARANADFAQQAGVDLDTIMDMFFNACLLDWPAESAKYQRLAKALEGADQVHITGKETIFAFQSKVAGGV